MKQPHKHAEVLRAIADGKEVQWYDARTAEWGKPRGYTPLTYPELEWRVMPEPKPDVVESLFVMPLATGQTRNDIPHNLRLTFDGETGKLKNAEVLE